MRGVKATKIAFGDWKRYPIYSFFKETDFPFYHITFPIDVTALKMYTKKNGLSFYLSMIYFVMKSINQIEAFRYRIRNDELWLLEQIYPSFTFLKPGEEHFQIAVSKMKDGLAEFCIYATDLMERQKAFIELDDSILPDEFVYLSSLPWLEVTSVSNERKIDVDDAIPRITWGKYVEENGRLRMSISIEVNHKFIDGYHIGLFSQNLQSNIDGLE